MRDRREYGLNKDDRGWIIKNKFDVNTQEKVRAMLQKVNNQSDTILGAVVFLTRADHIDDLLHCVKLANEDEQQLLSAATVKDERT